MAKRYEELTLADDFMFCKVLQNNPQVCQELTELILGKRIGKFAAPEPQKTIQVTPDGHGVRFDVYFEDDEDTIFDIEMQQAGVVFLAKRTRYYQGMIDLNQLEKGQKYEKLKSSYIVFISLENPYKEVGRHIYSFQNVCTEAPELKMGDETTKIFLCSKGTQDDVSDELKAFLDYIAGGEPSTEMTKELENLVHKAREHKEWRLEYMTLLERDEMMREEGRKEERVNTLREKQRADSAEQRADSAEQRADSAEQRAADLEQQIAELKKQLTGEAGSNSERMSVE